ncbi:MAG: MBL fold metallo-hydrolase, partial [Lachnospiraceae bacterium]|nr:MBL fold metallo-hydrolase [Lachnospiraceae bacterium]
KYVFLTHAHDDHAGFLNDVLRRCCNGRISKYQKSDHMDWG